MEIKYVCSLGSLCHSSQILKQNNLKKCSYPFDWIFSNYNNIIHCMIDDFKIFLDKSYYISISDKQCGHLYYHKQMFNHHNPLNNENDYNYYIRCVNRFKQLIQYEEHKLFIMIFPNMNNLEEKLKNNIIDFNNKFSKYTKNYTLFVIFHIKNKANNHHIFTHNDNIDFLELHTLSPSDGNRFININDNIYLNNIINKTYNFNIENKLIIHFEENECKENIKYKYENLPDDFNWKIYTEINKDLPHMNDNQAKLHFEIYGYKENRKYKYENLPDDFNWKIYTEINTDLRNMNEVEAKLHFERHGHKENRKYKYEN
jgi:hypothetical protein